MSCAGNVYPCWLRPEALFYNRSGPWERSRPPSANLWRTNFLAVHLSEAAKGETVSKLLLWTSLGKTVTVRGEEKRTLRILSVKEIFLCLSVNQRVHCLLSFGGVEMRTGGRRVDFLSSVLFTHLGMTPLRLLALTPTCQQTAGVLQVFCLSVRS